CAREGPSASSHESDYYFGLDSW
nr:immunoglobulin heavy chain junction region [Macaca mulatta]MOV38169.1 immunoglobulin heavy chain junction region [Macaca mulatta]MOV39075.1 immunoglobulin heavy chain junction region [Macaca mulatta]MOV39214.1 immunoglobulin heavy chain junction region [Macaca mulatta]MOV40497.1 immunoglobulin heavy chain junction region [Macaca mulatta]